MPIKPPNLDDRRFHDLVAEARALIPQYCPEWTNLSDADPGMTLVQLFAWMTEMTIYRLNRVADKTYVHFLNFIGEERRPARPALVPVTFALREEQPPCELPAFSRIATRQREDSPALGFLAAESLTIHDSHIQRIMAVRGGQHPAVREVPSTPLGGHAMALSLSGGRGIQIFDLDPERHGLQAYTPHQYLYVGDDDIRLMNVDPESGRPLGQLKLTRPGDSLSIVPFFRWEYPTAEGWRPVPSQVSDKEVMGMPDAHLVTAMPGVVQLERMGLRGDDFAVPDALSSERWWIRGTLDYERWLAQRMLEDLDVTWQDDRGGETRPLNNWEVRSAGRVLEFFLQDCPPVREGWRIRFALIDRGLPAGRSAYLPKYRWSYRRGESWEPVPDERVRVEGTAVEILGPLTEMAADGYNLRAERIETVVVQGLLPELEIGVEWIRPVEIDLLAGDDPRRTEVMLLDEAPWSPFQLNPVMPPTIGRKLYIGSDLFENRRKSPVLMEIEIGFEMNGEPVVEPKDKYALQLTYRAEDSWRVVHTKDAKYAGFTFAQLDKDGAKKAGRRRVRIVVDPKSQLKGLARHEVNGLETTWLRLELQKANLSAQDEDKNLHPIVPRIYGIRLGADKTLGDGTYNQPIQNPKLAQVDHRERNRRLTRCITKAAGRMGEVFPSFGFVDIDDAHQALYLQFDKPLPAGNRHAVRFLTRGEAFLPEGVGVEWEVLEKRRRGVGWRRLVNPGSESGENRASYDFTKSGELSFALPDVPDVSDDGFWIRARFTTPDDLEGGLPALPPVTHVLLNTVEAINLHPVTGERFSGLGVPHQQIQLGRKPIFLHPMGTDQPIFPRPELFSDLALLVDVGAGQTETWQVARGGNLLTAEKDDRLFVVDPVEGTLTFGNGIRGKMLPVGAHNVRVQRYHTVPGAAGNIGVGEIELCEAVGDRARPTNLLPATGGRDAETVDQIMRRAPSILTSRDRAVTRSDFEIIAAEASGEVARAACRGTMGEDGAVDVTVLPRRRSGERVPDPFLAAGLRDHVESYLADRCLINVQPKVRLATYTLVDVSVTLRLRPNANLLMVREAAQAWVFRFLDPYAGGLDGVGWPFGGTLYAQDFARLVADLGEVRHVADVQLFDLGDRRSSAPGWEEGEGLPELPLTDADLFEVRHVRILTEAGA